VKLQGLRCYNHPEYGYYKTSETECDYITAGINDIQNIGFSFSPNPVKDMLKVRLNESLSTPSTITIINSLGKTILVQKMEVQEQSISVKNLPNGVYFIRIEIDGSVESAMFIKQ